MLLPLSFRFYMLLFSCNQHVPFLRFFAPTLFALRLNRLGGAMTHGEPPPVTMFHDPPKAKVAKGQNRHIESL